MLNHARAILIGLALAHIAVSGATGAGAASSDSVEPATRAVEDGAKKTGEGLGDTARGIGQTVVEGTKLAGNTVAEAAVSTGRAIGDAGKVVGRGAKTAWETARDGVLDFADDVLSFLTRPF